VANLNKYRIFLHFPHFKKFEDTPSSRQTLTFFKLLPKLALVITLFLMTFLRQNWPIFEDAHPPIKKLTIFKQNGKVPFWPIFAKTDQNISTFCHFWPNQKKFEDTHIQFSKEQKLFTTMSKECQIKLISPKSLFVLQEIP